MIAAVHALLGATLARYCRGRAQAALAGGASHLLADMLPHRDLNLPQEAGLLAGALTLVAAARGVGSREFAGALGAVLPDLENIVARLRGRSDERLLLPTHNRHHGRRTGGFTGQAGIALLGAAALLLPPPASERAAA